MGEFLMPSLGADMDAGTIIEWRVAPGDAVHRGDIVAVVDTDKSDIEVEVFEEGVVEELLVEPGQTVSVGTPLARIVPADGAATPAKAPKPKAAKPKPQSAKPKPEAVKPKAVTPKPAPVAAPAGTVRASPYARRLAAEHGVDLAGVAGSGPAGAVVAADLTPTPELAPAAPPVAPAPPGDRADKKAAMRRAIADLMSRSNREIPTYHLVTTIDLGPALAWLADENLRRPVERRLLPAALLLKATALAARQVPAMNGFWVEGFQAAPAVHLGVAVSLRGGGLVAPAIHDADALSLDDLMAALRDLVERARAGRLRTSEMADPSITVTNLGEQGADEVHGVIYPPQVALVGFGRVVERPWAVDGLIGVRPTVRASLAADHRASDGHEGSRLLTAIDHLLHAPEEL